MLDALRDELQQLTADIDELTRLGQCSVTEAQQLAERLQATVAEERARLRRRSSAEDSLTRQRNSLVAKLDHVGAAVEALTRRLGSGGSTSPAGEASSWQLVSDHQHRMGESWQLTDEVR